MAFGVGAVGAAISVGVSLAQNEVDNRVSASIVNASAHGQSVQTRSGGAIGISASEQATIHAFGLAASAALGAGLAGVSFAGAGVDVVNAIQSKTNASVSNAILDSGGSVDIAASDTSIIEARVLALSGSAAIGIVSGAVSVGVATARNLIGYDLDGTPDASEVQASIVDSSIDAVGAVALDAEADATISATVEAVSLALAGGAVAISGAGAATRSRCSRSTSKYRPSRSTSCKGDRPRSISGLDRDNFTPRREPCLSHKAPRAIRGVVIVTLRSPFG